MTGAEEPEGMQLIKYLELMDTLTFTSNSPVVSLHLLYFVVLHQLWVSIYMTGAGELERHAVHKATRINGIL